MSSSALKPPQDERLRVRLATSKDGYIVGSCHTFPGRFAVWIHAEKLSICASLADIADATPEALYWIRGFLAGSTPKAPEDPAFEIQWARARAEFLETGHWNDEGLP